MATNPTTRTGYAVFNANGELLWFTIRRTKVAAKLAYKTETSDVVPKSFEVKPVTIAHNGN